MRQTIKVLMFASAAEQIGGNTVELALTLPTTIAVIAEEIGFVYPSLSGMLSRSRFAVNNQFVDRNFMLTNAAEEIAMIPPVSGG